MTSSVRILTTASVDSTPSLLIIATNGDKILINCGEGCQRAFLEASGLRLKSVKRICLTHLHPTALGGLPGLVLTSADANESAIVAIAAAEQEKAIRNQGGNQKKKGAKGAEEETVTSVPNVDAIVSAQPLETSRPQTAGSGDSFKPTSKRPSPATVDKEMMGGIEMHGPVGTQGFLYSLRHFMRRDRFETRVYEGEQQQPLEPAKAPEPKKKRKKNNKNSSEPQSVDFSIQALAFQHSRIKESVPMRVSIQSYIFRTPPLVGKFRPDKAQKLGIPKGPMYAQLKNGQSVTFPDAATGDERTVHSCEVLDAASPGVAVAVIYCPTANVLQQLKECKDLEVLRNPTDDTPVDVMVHMTPLVQDTDYQAWVATFPDEIDHIWLDTYETLQEAATQESDIRSEASPFVGASLGGMMRSMINPEIHPSPIVEQQNSASKNQVPDTMIVGKRHLEYILIPRSKRGIKEEKEATLLEKIEDSKTLVKESGALELASKELPHVPATPSVGEILFSGTGSALPCKHRNVTGICLTISESQRMLLDCGEGTVGQLFRVNPDMGMKSIQGVWISHPHADHHLGILRLLSERNSIPGLEPLILIAPPNLFAFLAEYEVIDPTILGSYTKLDCYDLVAPSTPSLEMKQLLETRLGITSLKAVHVSHCRHSFAIVMDCNAPGSLGRVAYSGDCRPSMKFADLAVDADILIHEATFEDGMENEAVLKRHSTVGEALQVAKRMRAKTVLLTHFSQRYPRIPPLQMRSDDKEEAPVVFCFDFTRLTPATIPLAAKLTGALRLLYPEETDEKGKSTSESGNEVDAKTIMAIPGIFAQSELL